MANQLASLPWSVDTPSASPVFSGQVKVSHFLWSGYQNTTDQVVVTDKNGNPVFQSVGNADLSPVSSDFSFFWVNGLIVLTLGSGVLYIVVE